ncbi:maleylacetoacetate isomerase [Alkalimonas collagenimarina]|uniref:Maleylacetoacetate isomerase n=1 Tax=Alkalimonas collagenimarina TaxID=400390 RepID=A0ABT9GVD9_9GAMM|nr:maleylacetoacetate isomerase [Alkalimonas collagenimarina]MDP4535022.1 maleylacetoacetate isomerase [Alkalimonas collagenimarina]
MKLYGYWRSSAAYRVRIALAFKQLSFESVSVHLVKDGGQQHQADYKALNPAELVPTLQDGDLTLNQSLAMLEYIEEQYPEPALLPADVSKKAVIRAMALDIACDIHPLNNLRVLQYLTQTLQLTEQQKIDWIHHWLQTGFQALEQRLATTSGEYCFGNELTLADVCLVPQVYNALRFQLDMTPYPIIQSIYQHCNQLTAFQSAAPEQQADAQ